MWAPYVCDIVCAASRSTTEATWDAAFTVLPGVIALIVSACAVASARVAEMLAGEARSSATLAAAGAHAAIVFVWQQVARARASDAVGPGQPPQRRQEIIRRRRSWRPSAALARTRRRATCSSMISAVLPGARQGEEILHDALEHHILQDASEHEQQTHMW